ncbi:hypothetical protein ACFSKU_07555 [Pontibacter silvestris]|uniref:DUF3575 domain-containing protein n=1 Tax=Pontibacter silvestris TaxID=2305183 RepID=A0ABW4WWX2_9BACT|nr:hypothetical protein [Pontibacter silvestris]MCC9136646.1 hypothetical protein [Pontibacter silvestris]
MLFFGVISQAVAQAQFDSLRIQKQVDAATSPAYKFALGVRRAVIVGEYDFGITGKYFLSGTSALEVGMSKALLKSHAYQLSGMYERHNRLFRSKNFFLYYGAGGGILVFDKQADGLLDENDKVTAKGAIGYIAGIEAGLGKIPLAVSFDFKSLYYIKGNTPVYRVLNVVGPGISLKYRFGMNR